MFFNRNLCLSAWSDFDFLSSVSNFVLLSSVESWFWICGFFLCSSMGTFVSELEVILIFFPWFIWWQFHMCNLQSRPWTSLFQWVSYAQWCHVHMKQSIWYPWLLIDSGLTCDAFVVGHLRISWLFALTHSPVCILALCGLWTLDIFLLCWIMVSSLPYGYDFCNVLYCVLAAY